MTLTYRTALAIVTVAALEFATAAPSWAGSAGALDPSFGSGGKVVTALGTSATVEALAVRRTIVAAGSVGAGRVGVVRYLPTGQVDKTFAQDGVAISTLLREITGAAITYLHKVLVVGFANSTSTVSSLLIRYTAQGRPDKQFGKDGAVNTGPEFIDRSMALQSDGKIILVGDDGSDFIVQRRLPNGHPDLTFGGGDGTVITDVGGLQQIAVGGLIQPDGKILVLGFSYVGCCGERDKVTMVRYRRNGGLDRSFGTEGKVLLHASSQFPVGLGLQSTAKIVLAASPFPRLFGYPSCSGGVVMRLDPHGQLDASFAHLGKRVVAQTGVVGMAVASGDRILVAGDSCSEGPPHFGLTRYLADGSVDAGFGDHGTVDTGIGSGDTLAFALGLQRDGKIIEAGGTFSRHLSAHKFALARYLAA